MHLHISSLTRPPTIATELNNTSIANASVLFPDEADLKVITGKASKGIHYAALMAKEKGVWAETLKSKALISGPPAIDRRASLMILLDEVEMRIAKEVMGKVDASLFSEDEDEKPEVPVKDP